MDRRPAVITGIQKSNEFNHFRIALIRSFLVRFPSNLDYYGTSWTLGESSSFIDFGSIKRSWILDREAWALLILIGPRFVDLCTCQLYDAPLYPGHGQSLSVVGHTIDKCISRQNEGLSVSEVTQGCVSLLGLSCRLMEVKTIWGWVISQEL